MTVERVAAGDRLRIAVLGDFDGVHTRSWLRWFVERGHDMHGISYYPPASPLDGVTMHVLQPRQRKQKATNRKQQTTDSRGVAGPAGGMMRGPVRFVHGARYLRAGLRRVVREIAPDVFHGHFVVEHGFYGALGGVHPYVVTAWGSDVLVAPHRDPISRQIARWTLRRAELATSNNAYMAGRMIALGAPIDRVHQITLGADRYFLEGRARSVNVREDTDGPMIVLSTRAHEPLYNIEGLIEAYDRLVRHSPDVRLVVAHGGTLTPRLSRRAADSPGRVEMMGFVDREHLREAMRAAAVFVSVPSSDGTSVALLQAMAAGCFPIVSDLPTQREWIDDGVNGFRVPLHRPDILAERIKEALADGELRRRAAALNAAIVEERGLNENEMAKMEQLYLQLASRRLS